MRRTRPDVEDGDGRAKRPAARRQQDAGDEESTEDEEQPDAHRPKRGVAIHPGDEVEEQDEDDGYGPETV